MAMDHNFISDRFLNEDVGDVLAETSSEVDPPEDLDFSDEVLKYINHILMEEDLEDKICMFQESSALEAAERSLYEILGEQHPSSINDQLVPNLDKTTETPYYDKFFGESKNCFVPHDWHTDPNQLNATTSQSTSQSSYNSSSSTNVTIIDGPMDFSVITPKIPDIFSCNESAVQFKKGVEEARKFLPSGSNHFIYMKCDESVEKKFDNVGFYDSSRGKKNPYDESIGLQEERNSKQSAVYFESTVSPDMFDEVLLDSGGLNESALPKVTKNSAHDDATTHSKGSSGGKKQAGKKNVVDLRTLLTLCAQSITADDYRSANEFLKQIRRHSTPTGDGMQRLAHYFADGLEARMAGSDTRIHNSIPNMPASASNALKAYHIYLATCPFRKISNFFANRTIMNMSENVTRLHIIDFGILYGFQWPSFLQCLSTRPGGPPRLRITGIDFPCRGFRPSERVEETGRRLTSYAESFGVPFEFNAVAQKWETIKLEDLKMEENELVVVNSLFRLRNLLDESVVVKSPRNIVLNLIRKMNPAVFVLGIMNGAHNGPFFSTRFREALFHYSAIFDMLDANIPREVHERMLVEKVVFGRQAMNVIACEEGERTERPETYKQWQVRNMRAGFDQLHLDKEIMEMARNKVKSCYHKDFVIDEDEDGVWMLQGWKGRIIYALSSWRPTNY